VSRCDFISQGKKRKDHLERKKGNDEKGKGKDLLDLFSSGFFLLEEYIKNSETK
jgi:hypothetical protein